MTTSHRALAGLRNSSMGPWVPVLPIHGFLFSKKVVRDILYAPSHRQDIIFHGLFYDSCGELFGITNS